MKPWFIALTISCLFFIFSTPVQASSHTPTVLFLPLDSRPVHTDVPQLMSDTMGIHLLTPPLSLLGNLQQRGDTKALMTWIEEQAPKADAFVLSADMLAYGGLVASRTDDITLLDVKQRILWLRALKKAYPTTPLYVHSSLLRLAPTVTTQDDKKAYEQLREWAILMGSPTLNQRQLAHLTDVIPDNLLSSYQQIRSRHHAMNETLIALANEQVIDALVFGQDDAAKKGIHQAEKKALLQQIKSDSPPIYFVSGIDEVPSMFLARFALTTHEIQPTVSVQYDHPLAPFWTSPFDSVRTAVNVFEHLQVVGFKQTPFSFQADTILYVNTPFANWHQPPRERVAIADIATVNKGDKAFASSVLSTVPLSELYSYSGWNTGGNAIGLSLSFAAARIVSFDQPSQTKTLRHAALLYRSLFVDVGYKTTLYPRLQALATTKEHDPYALNEHTPMYEQAVAMWLATEKTQWLDPYFHHQTFYTNREQTKTVTITDSYFSPVSLPWQRLFEVRISPILLGK